MVEEQQKWVSKLMGFDFEVKYKPGQHNSVADALSRRLHMTAISTVQFIEWEGIEEELFADEKLKKVMQELLVQPDKHAGFELKQGKLWYKGRLVLPKTSARIPMVLKEFHDSVAGGYSGFFRTYKRISST